MEPTPLDRAIMDAALAGIDRYVASPQDRLTPWYRARLAEMQAKGELSNEDALPLLVNELALAMCRVACLSRGILSGIDEPAGARMRAHMTSMMAAASELADGVTADFHRWVAAEEQRRTERN